MMKLFKLVLVCLIVLCIHSSSSKPHARKQKRMVEMVSRHLLEDRHKNSRFFTENEMMKRRFKEMVQALPKDIKTNAMRELLYMFDLPEPVINTLMSNPLHQVKKPPKYMVDLYNTIADRHGITRAPGLLDADTVRSIPNIDKNCPKSCRFDLRPVDSRETILDAELHVYQERPKFGDRFTKPGSYFIKIYQTLPPKHPSGKTRKALVAARRLPSHLYGWQIFPLLTTVERWNIDGSENLGITIETTSKRGKVMTSRSLSKWKQPILVLFSNNSDHVIHHSQKTKTIELLNRAQSIDDNVPSSHDRAEIVRSKRSTKNPKKSKAETGHKKSEKKTEKTQNPENAHISKVNKTTQPVESWESYDYGKAFDDYVTWDVDYAADGSSGKNTQPSGSSHSFSGSTARFPSFSTLSTESSASRSCRRYPLYVDFEEMGWSGWIIHPQGYNAYHCRGKCAFPLGQNLKPSNHATVQSIMHTLGLGGQPVDMPCCTPDQLYDINLLYFDHNDYVVLRRYKDMVAASCACR
uniref:ADMP n=1 Tax=Phallusia mammillata TaxID=59560 RepID=A0A6F9D8F1_9ASCI|nr:ADMP [Phallusia mammillata]